MPHFINSEPNLFLHEEYGHGGEERKEVRIMIGTNARVISRIEGYMK